MARKPTNDTDFINRRQYEHYTGAEWKGVRVILINEIQTRSTRFPAGTKLTIERKAAGFELRGPKCDCCGLTPIASSVNPSNLRILDDDE